MVRWEEGKKLKNGKYTVQKFLDEGGFGYTYKVLKTRNDKYFVIKTLKDDILVEKNIAEVEENFINEAMKLSSCRHPNIVRVYSQTFREEGMLCMVMEYIEGQSLHKYIEKNGQISEFEAISLIDKIGRALIQVHDRELIHCDINPKNIMLRNCSLLSPVLIDFGLAKEFDPDKSISISYEKTLHFAPLEQYNLEDLSDYIDVEKSEYKIGKQTDIYALSATLYNLLTGTKPMQAVHRMLSPEFFKSPQALNSKISERVNEAIIKGMALQPSERPKSAYDFLNLLSLPELEYYRESNLKTNSKSSIKSQNLLVEGNELMAAKKYSYAIEYYEEALKIDSCLYEVWNSQGIAFYALREYEDALMCFDRAIEIKSNYHIAWSNRGDALRQLNHYSKAIFSYDKAIEIEPNFYEAYFTRGLAFRELKLWEEEVKSYNRAIAN